MKQLLVISIALLVIACGCSHISKPNTISDEEADSIFAIVKSIPLGKSSSGLPDGWWVYVETSKQQAPEIAFSIGTDGDNAEFWKNWKTNEPAGFLVLDKYKNVAELYIGAVSNPHGKTSFFWVGYSNCIVQRFEFDVDENHKMKQTDHIACAK